MKIQEIQSMRMFAIYAALLTAAASQNTLPPSTPAIGSFATFSSTASPIVLDGNIEKQARKGHTKQTGLASPSVLDGHIEKQARKGHTKQTGTVQKAQKVKQKQTKLHFHKDQHVKKTHKLNKNDPKHRYMHNDLPHSSKVKDHKKGPKASDAAKGKTSLGYSGNDKPESNTSTNKPHLEKGVLILCAFTLVVLFFGTMIYVYIKFKKPKELASPSDAQSQSDDGGIVHGIKFEMMDSQSHASDGTEA